MTNGASYTFIDFNFQEISGKYNISDIEGRRNENSKYWNLTKRISMREQLKQAYLSVFIRKVCVDGKKEHLNFIMIIILCEMDASP